MEEMIWYEDKLPEGLKPTTAHAVLVTKDGRVLIRYKDGNMRRVTGGHIDSEDKNIEETLRRELKEEINCEIDKCDYLGYILYRAPDGTEEIWLRMVARLAEIGPARPDPDQEEIWTYGRTIMPAEMAEREITEDDNFAKIMPRMMELAMETAEKNEYFTEAKNDKKEIINLEERIIR